MFRMCHRLYASARPRNGVARHGTSKSWDVSFFGHSTQRTLQWLPCTAPLTYGPTLLIDEADTVFTNGGHNELRGILNAGLYRSTSFILRCSPSMQLSKLCFRKRCLAVELHIFSTKPGTFRSRSRCRARNVSKCPAITPYNGISSGLQGR